MIAFPIENYDVRLTLDGAGPWQLQIRFFFASKVTSLDLDHFPTKG